MAPPLALRPPPPPDRGPKNIAEFIRRMNAEPGGFRALDEDDIRRRIAAQKNKADADAEMEDADEADDEPSKTAELVAARDDLMRNINVAQRTATATLDFISLLLSKDLPVQASATLNPGLRNMVGIGTLSATVLNVPSALTMSRVPDQKMVAIGMRLQAVNKAADSLESAANRLHQEIDLETTYWNEVRAVSERSWSVFRHPDEPHTMAVKFGFSNAAPDFKASSIAPLRRAEDGSVQLEHNRMTRVSKRLQVTIKQGDYIVGQSHLPRPLEDDVKEARDTVFSQELWHELNREGRNLLSFNVRLIKDTVVYNENADRTISFQLVTLDQDNAGLQDSRPADTEAERISVLLHLLLINAHRKNELLRSQRSVPGANKGPAAPYELLFPIIVDRQHETTIQHCIHFFYALRQTLRRAGLPSTFRMSEPPITGDSTKSLADSLLNPPAVEFDLSLTPATPLRITARPFGRCGTRFHVALLSPEDPKIRNPLEVAYPPSTYREGGVPAPANVNPSNDNLYDNATKLFQYICNAIPRAIIWHFKDVFLQSSTSNAPSPSDTSPRWVVDTFCRALLDNDMERGIHFDCKLLSDADSGNSLPELLAAVYFGEGTKKFSGEWAWKAEQGPSDGKTLDELVRELLVYGNPHA